MRRGQSRKALGSIAAVFILSMLLLISTSFAFKTGFGFSLSGFGTTLKDTPAASYWYVGGYSYDNVTFSNSGVRTTIEVRSQQVSSFLSFWISDTMSNNLWAQVGYYYFHSSGPIAFFQVWNLTTRTEVASRTSAVFYGVHTFSMELLEDDNWSFSVDSHQIGTYNMKTSVSSPNDSVTALSEEGYCNSPFSFQPVSFTEAIQVLHDGTWFTPAHANIWRLLGSSRACSEQHDRSKRNGCRRSLSFYPFWFNSLEYSLIAPSPR